jgi:lipid-binding SYLF domain-containing protein
MKYTLRNCVLLAISTAALSAITVQAADEDLQAKSQQAISSFQSMDSSMKSLMDSAAGYAVFPDVGKGGFIIGGAHGKGLLYEKGVATGQASITQASIGAQAGGESFAEIIFFQTPEAVSNFKTGQFELSAEVSAVAVKDGASKAAQYKDGVEVFTMAKKGLMVSASVGGQKFKYEALQPTGR